MVGKPVKFRHAQRVKSHIKLMKIWLLIDWVLFWICHSSRQKCIAETKNEIYKAIKANTNAVYVKGFFQAKKTAQTYFKYRLSNHRTIFWGQSFCHHRCFSSFTSIWFDLKWKLSTRVPSRGAVYYAVQGGSNFWVCGWNPKVWPCKWKLLSSAFLWCCLLCCTKWFWLFSLYLKSSSVIIQLEATDNTFLMFCLLLYTSWF